MQFNKRFGLGSASLVLLVSCGLPGCAGNQSQPPPAPQPTVAPPPPATTSAPLAAAPPPAAPSAAPVEAAPARPKHHLGPHHMLAAMFFWSTDSVELKPEQRATVEGIEAELEKVPDAAAEPHRKLANDIADGVAAGKLNRAKTDADLRALTTAVAAAQTAEQDALNRLHQALEPEQRKKLVETMREKARQMQEHMDAGMHGEMGPGMHGEMGPGMHGGMGPGMHGGMGPGMHGGAAPGAGKGPAAGPNAAGGGPGVGATAGGKGPGMGAGMHQGMGPGPGRGPGMGPGMAPGMASAPGKGPGMHQGMGPGPGKGAGMGPGMHDMGAAMMMHLSEDLALTPEQSEKIRAQLETQRKAQEGPMKARFAAMQKHLTAVGDAFMTDKFDAKKAGVGSQAAEMVKAMATQHLKAVETITAALTPEQRAKFAQHIREHAAQHEAAHAGQ